jgi:hypothetical protein
MEDTGRVNSSKDRSDLIQATYLSLDYQFIIRQSQRRRLVPRMKTHHHSLVPQAT